MGIKETNIPSDMAEKHFERLLGLVLSESDPIERVKKLIESAYSVGEMATVVASAAAQNNEQVQSPFDPAFGQGVRFAITALIEAGMPLEDFPVEGLSDRARQVSLGSSAMLEASVLSEGGDIRELYFVEDGGTAEA